MKEQYTIKVSIVEVDEQGTELGTSYSMTYSATSTDLDGLVRIVDSTIDYHIDALWQDDLVELPEIST